MKKTFLSTCLLLCILVLSGCGEHEMFRYEKCRFQNEESSAEWIPESYEGVSAEVREATSENLAVELKNDLEHNIIFDGWSRPYVKQEETWYTLLPAEETDSPAIGTISEEDRSANTILSGDSMEASIHFPDAYQGAALPSGEYRIRLAFHFPSDRGPTRMEHEGVWVDFIIEE